MCIAWRQRAISHDREASVAWLTYPCPLAIDYNAYISPLNCLLRISEMLGKLVHFGIDAMILSAFLAGIKRSTGLTCVRLSHL
jgi:Fungal protein of unknown function (DUF1748)